GFRCSTCGEPLRQRWQGKDGTNALLVWRQGQAAPVEYHENVASESKIDAETVATWRLPATFNISNWCQAWHMTDATGRCRGDVWSETLLR
ncbi:MAG: hypothetical protein ACRD1T_19715, partial [Acidimicrobiia bacterium]